MKKLYLISTILVCFLPTAQITLATVPPMPTCEISGIIIDSSIEQNLFSADVQILTSKDSSDYAKDCKNLQGKTIKQTVIQDRNFDISALENPHKMITGQLIYRENEKSQLLVAKVTDRYKPANDMDSPHSLAVVASRLFFIISPLAFLFISLFSY